MPILVVGPCHAPRRATAPSCLLMALLCLVDVPPIDALETDLTQGDEVQPQGASPHPQWLDEVRAQRQARETRREEARKAMDARHRLIDPWGAAQQEAREREIDLRRQATRERIEQEREQFWSRRPPITAFPEPNQPYLPPWQPTVPLAAEPPGWDNLWYYQGY